MQISRNYFSAAHILSRKGLKGMNPSSSSGSHSSFIRPLASSLVSFSPRLVSSRNSWCPSMVSSLFLSYSFRISTKSWNPPWSLDSLAALYMGKQSFLLRVFLPFSLASDLGNGLQGGVKVAGSHQIAGIEGVNLAISLEVIDIEGEVDGINFLFLKTKLSHGCSFFFAVGSLQDLLPQRSGAKSPC